MPTAYGPWLRLGARDDVGDDDTDRLRLPEFATHRAMVSHGWCRSVRIERADATRRRAARGTALARSTSKGGAAMTKERQSLPELIEEVVAQSATTVEEIHKSIADLPLKLMEESELLRKPAREVRRLQDKVIGAIYDVVRDTNRRIAKLVSDLLERQRTRGAQTGRAAAA